MKSKLHILALTAVAMMLIAGCSVRRDRERIETAEALLYSNRDSAELLIRQVERPERLDDAHLAKYWFVTCDLHANSMQSLSEDSMICWTADYYRQQWKGAVHELNKLNKIHDLHSDKTDNLYTDELNSLAQKMMLSGLDEAMYYWWNGDKEKTQEVLQRQKGYADEVAERTDEHVWQVVVLRVSAELAMRDYKFELVRDYTEALIALDDGKAIHLDEVERVYNALAIVYFSFGDYDKMEQYFEKAIANAADSAFIVNVVRRNYADLLGEIGHTDRAIRMLEELTEEYRKADNWLQVESLYSLSRMWLNKSNKQHAEQYMHEAEDLFAKYKDSSEFDPAAEAEFLAHRQVLEYAQKGSYHFYPLVEYHNHWSEKDYVRYRVAEAKERSIRDLRERNLYLTISRQRTAFVVLGLLMAVLVLCSLLLYLYRRRKRMLIEKEEEIETLREMLNASARQETPKHSDTSETPDILENSNTSANPAQSTTIQQLMLRQLGIIKTIAGTPTEANRHLLARLMALNETTADALIDWQSIYQTIDLVYDGFYTKLVEKYGIRELKDVQGNEMQTTIGQGPLLNEKEIQLCCLLRAGFSTKEINMLTRQSMQTIYQRKTQIRQKLGLQEGEDIIENIFAGTKDNA